MDGTAIAAAVYRAKGVVGSNVKSGKRPGSFVAGLGVSKRLP